jgi:hypothetical protein
MLLGLALGGPVAYWIVLWLTPTLTSGFVYRYSDTLWMVFLFIALSPSILGLACYKQVGLFVRRLWRTTTRITEWWCLGLGTIVFGVATYCALTVHVLHTANTVPTVPRQAWIVLEIGVAALLLVVAFDTVLACLRPTRDKAPDTQRRPGTPDCDAAKEKPDDLFPARRTFAIRTAREVLHLNEKRAMCFGIEGKWGEGKTSVLRAVRQQLDRAGRILGAHTREALVTVWYDPWNAATTSDMVSNLFAEVDGAVSKQFVAPGLHRLFRKYGKLVGAAAGHRAVEAVIDIMGDASVSRVADDLKHCLERLRLHLVVFVDDVDRLDPDQAQTLFRVVRLTFDFPRTVFLLGYDHDAALRAAKKLGDRNYLDKIIQVERPVPRADTHDLMQMLDREVDWLKAQRSLPLGDSDRASLDSDLQKSRAEVFRPCLETVRDVKRLVNDLVVGYVPLRGEVDLHDFMLLELLRERHPRVYKRMPRWKWLFCTSSWDLENAGRDDPESGRHFLEEHKKNAEAIKAEFSNFLQRCDLKESDATFVSDILKLLFPRLRNDVGRGQSEFAGPSHEDRGAYRARRRVAHPKYFERYFLNASRAGLIDDETITILTDSVRSNSPTLLDEYNQALSKAAARHTALDFMQGMNQALAMACSERSADIAAVYAKTAREQFGHDEALLRETARAILTLADNAPNDGLAAKILKDAVMELSDYAAALMVGEVRSSVNWNHKGAPVALAEAFAKRMQTRYGDGRNDIFATDQSDGIRLLTTWATCGINTRSDTDRYLARLLKERPERVTDLLTGFARSITTAAGNTMPIEPDYRGLKGVVEPTTVDLVIGEAEQSSRDPALFKRAKEWYEGERTDERTRVTDLLRKLDSTEAGVASGALKEILLYCANSLLPLEYIKVLLQRIEATQDKDVAAGIVDVLSVSGVQDISSLVKSLSHMYLSVTEEPIHAHVFNYLTQDPNTTLHPKRVCWVARNREAIAWGETRPDVRAVVAEAARNVSATGAGQLAHGSVDELAELQKLADPNYVISPVIPPTNPGVS